MKLITWNCNMAFRNKAHLLLVHKPDIVVIPECEHPDNLKFKDTTPKPTDMLWFGQNKHKGLGVFSYSDFHFKLSKSHTNDIQLIAPITVTNGRCSFSLIAIWANNPNDKDGRYITQVWKALHQYSRFLNKKPIILTGDFNSNTIWDKPRRAGNHSTVVKVLEEKDIHSVYHKFYKQEQGKETHPTLYMYRKQEKSYHIDYCFASNDLLKHLTSVEVGTHEEWCKHSDHVPVMATFNIEAFQ